MRTVLKILLFAVLLFSVIAAPLPQADAPADPISNVGARPRRLTRTRQVWIKKYTKFECQHVCRVDGKKTRRLIVVESDKLQMGNRFVKNLVSKVCPSRNSRNCSCQAIYDIAASRTKKNIQWILTWLNNACATSTTRTSIPTRGPTKTPVSSPNKRPVKRIPTKRWFTKILKKMRAFSSFKKSGRRTLSFENSLSFRKRRRFMRKHLRRKFRFLHGRKGRKTSHKRHHKRHHRKHRRQFHKSSKAVKLPPRHRYNTLELAELPQNVLSVETFGADQEFGF
eukprot:gene9395-1606_t